MGLVETFGPDILFFWVDKNPKGAKICIYVLLSMFFFLVGIIRNLYEKKEILQRKIIYYENLISIILKPSEIIFKRSNSRSFTIKIKGNKVLKDINISISAPKNITFKLKEESKNTFKMLFNSKGTNNFYMFVALCEAEEISCHLEVLRPAALNITNYLEVIANANSVTPKKEHCPIKY